VNKVALAMSICVLLLVLGAGVPVWAAQTGEYVLKWQDPSSDTVVGIKVKEFVDPLAAGGWRYMYWVETNGSIPPPGSGATQMGFGSDSVIVTFGFSEPLDGGPITIIGRGPAGSWSVTGDTGSTPTPVWDTSADISKGIWYDAASSNFLYSSAGAPHSLYDAFVTVLVDTDSDGTPETERTATGQISGPKREDFVTFTYTPGGWGAKPRGENPGTVLHNNFDSVYPVPPFPAPPNGPLVIGGDYTITFTGAQAITDYLPAGGPPKVLTKNHTDPTKKTEAGEFASQVLALQLNVDFSNAGILPNGLANWVLDSGPLAGKTVAEVLALANTVLGGDTSALPAGLSVPGLSDVVTYINEKFVP